VGGPLGERRATRQVMVGDVRVGGGAPVVVQSMTKTDTQDVEATVAQIQKLEDAGCEIVRVAVRDMDSCARLGEIKAAISIPLVADIHFDYRLALEAIRQGVDKLRLNPGNIGGPARVAEIVAGARESGIPIRIGVNAGSLEPDLLEQYGHPTAEAMVESAQRHVRLLEGLGFHEIVISLKGFDVPMTIDAYRRMSERVDYPLHIGITEAGLPPWGSIRSAVGLGILLAEGIGDTIRVSLTADPVEEVRAAYEILKSLNLREKGPIIISCPICGRCEVDIESMAARVIEELRSCDLPIRVAVMGCEVNGPGEAREADVGIAAGRNGGILFVRGKKIRRVDKDELLDALLSEVARLTRGRW
jgi:(E)-4-hydroxy-3-methylbut-2-enyl-diphosphate synthase